ncbi:MAG: hypothetical protein KGI45_03675 [Patescibacteria group bacterium]|nr:hypothetical protein [Patescibacteria group bacterium]
MERALEAGGPHVRMFYELLVDVIGLGEAFVLRPRGFVLTAEDASLWDNGTTDAVLYALRDAYLFEAIAYHEKRPPRS